VQQDCHFGFGQGDGDGVGSLRWPRQVDGVFDVFGKAFYRAVFRPSWKWRGRSSVKITERTREKDTEALHSRR
jgi:hypothetical protein